MESVLYDAAGHRRPPATLPGYHQGRSPRNKGLRYPADPPTVEEIVAVMRAAGNGADGARLRALIVILWRQACGSVRRSISPKLTSMRYAVPSSFAMGRAAGAGKCVWTAGLGAARAVDEIRSQLPVGALLCVIHGSTAGRRWEQSAARKQLRRVAAAAGVRRRFAPHH